MAQKHRKVRLSYNANEERLSILDFWYKKNGNVKYSRKLNNDFLNTISIIKQYEKIGKVIKNTNVRCYIKNNYNIYYEISESFIEILHIWDNRQNPDKITL